MRSEECIVQSAECRGETLREINRERRKRLRRIALIEWGMYATMAGVVVVPIIGVAWKIWKMRGGQP